MKTIIGITLLLVSLSFIYVLGANESITATGDWVAPTSANSNTNPFPGDEAAIASGKKLYNNYCGICHGNKGKGDGIGGVGLNPRPSNFTTEKVQNQSDGALFWKLTTGRAPMAGYKDILSEQERWQLINYIRILKK